MWKPEHRVAAGRKGLRYPSDPTDAEWALVEPLIPPAKRGGRPRAVNLREVLNAVFYVLWTGCQWGAAEGSAAQEHGARLFRAVGLGRHVGAHPRGALCRDARAREARGEPERGGARQPKRQVDAKRGAQDPQGYDAGKKITGRKQHILVDTLGLLLSVDVLPADVQDRDGIGTLLRRARKRFPFTGRIFADAGYQGPKVASVVAALGNWIFEIVKRTHITSTSCRGAGWSNEPSPGSAEIDGLPAISSATPALSPSSAASP